MQELSVPVPVFIVIPAALEDADGEELLLEILHHLAVGAEGVRQVTFVPGLALRLSHRLFYPVYCSSGWLGLWSLQYAGNLRKYLKPILLVRQLL